MINFFISLFCFISLSAFALDANSDKLQKNELSNKEIDRYVAEIPHIDFNQIRFMIPQPKWKNYEVELMSGPQVEVITKTENSKINAYTGPITFFKDSGLRQKAFSVDDNLIYENDKIICKYMKNNDVTIADTYYECSSNYCTKRILQKNKVRLENFSGMNRGWFDARFKPCRYLPKVFSFNFDGSDRSTIIKIDKLNDKKNAGEVTLDGSKFFLDLNFCLNHKEACKLKNKRISDFGRAFINLKISQRNKSYDELNYLLTNLKPCVLKKDNECIRKYLVDDPSRVAKEKSNYISVSNELIESLRNCLDYQSLLPYGGRLLDGKGKVCIIDDRNNTNVKIHSVTLPDAYKSDDRLINVNYEI